MRTRSKLVLARVLSRGLIALRRPFGLGTIAEVARRGISWRLDLAEGIDLAIYLQGVFEPAVGRAIRRLVPPGSAVLDLGANLGAHTLALAQQVGGDGRVVAVEATDYAMAKLTENLRRNPLLADRVTTVQALLVAEEPGRREETGHSDPPAVVYSSWPLGAAEERDPEVHPLHGGRAMSTGGARITTVDALVDELGLARIDFVKLDVDGNEAGVLAGAALALERHRPTLLMEMAPYVFAAGELERLVALLAASGYRLTDLAGREALPLDAGALRRIVPHGSGRNVLARAAPAPGERGASAGARVQPAAGAGWSRVWRGARQRLLLLVYGLAVRCGVLAWRPVERLFLALYFRYKSRRESAALAYLEDLVGKRPRGSESTVIDVGANCGFFTTVFAAWSRVGHVVAIEPEDTNHRRLVETLGRRGLAHKVTAVKALADAASGDGSLEVNPLHHGDHRIATAGSGTPVASVAIDELVTQHEVSLIKIDVQGAEMRVLAGAEQTVARCAPAIYLEVDEQGMGRYGGGVDDLLAWCLAHGYRAHLPTSFRPAASADAIRRFVDATGEGYADVLLLPASSAGSVPRGHG